MASDATLGPTRRLTLGVLAIVIAAGAFAAGRVVFTPGSRVAQPIEFNHLKHVKGAGLECSTCHQYYAEHEHSGLPDLASCLTCHQEPITKSPEEKKLIGLAAGPSPPAFQKLFRLPDHTYYSHRRHVTIAGLACETCHGAIGDSVVPPSDPLVRVSMSACIGCHARESVRTDCTICHR